MVEVLLYLAQVLLAAGLNVAVHVGLLAALVVGIGYPFGNESTISWGQRYDKLGNADLGWETTEAFNYGFDLGLLGSRIYLEFDGYFSKTTDQIFDRLLPVMNNGLTSMKATIKARFLSRI